MDHRTAPLVALYARVSTDTQQERGFSIGAQIEDARAYAAAQGWRIPPDREFVDTGSGSDWELPGAAKITATVLTQAEPGSVVLLHDAGGNRQGTVDALRRILPDLTARFELEALPTDPT